MQLYTVYFIWKLLYMFRVVPPPIFRGRKQLYLQHLVFVTPLLLSAAIVDKYISWQISDAVDAFVCAPDDGWRYRTKHVEQFPDINKLCNVASRWIYRVSQEEGTKLRESVPCVKIYRYKPKHLYPKLNGYGDNGQRSLKLWQLLHTYWLINT